MGDFSPKMRLKGFPKNLEDIGKQAAKFGQREYLAKLRLEVLRMYRESGSSADFNVPQMAKDLDC